MPKSPEPGTTVPCWQRGFAGVIKVRLLRWEISQDYPSGPKVITRVLIRRQQESWKSERGVRRIEQEVGVMYSADGGRGESQEVQTASDAGEGQKQALL